MSDSNEQQILNRIAEEIAREIDEEILQDMIKHNPYLDNGFFWEDDDGEKINT